MGFFSRQPETDNMEILKTISDKEFYYGKVIQFLEEGGLEDRYEIMKSQPITDCICIFFPDHRPRHRIWINPERMMKAGLKVNLIYPLVKGKKKGIVMAYHVREENK